MVTLAVDCMGGDFGPSVTLAACKRFLDTHTQANLLLAGLSQAFAHWPIHTRAQVIECGEMVQMDDTLEVALRKKKDSSMRVAIAQVKNGRSDACVSAGNTGALMAIARYLLKTMEGIDRPAIASFLPNAQGRATMVLDLGANVDCSPEHLLQFAVMGSALASSLGVEKSPSVGLLNVGEESIKGSDIVKRAGELLRQAASNGNLNFYGNVEGDDIYKGSVDIVVCDGFVGNVALKVSEGLASMVALFLKEAFTRNLGTKLVALISAPVLRSFRSRVDHRRYNGAALLGLNGLVFKSHGSADAEAFYQALCKAHDAAERKLLMRVRKCIESVASPCVPQQKPSAPGYRNSRL